MTQHTPGPWEWVENAPGQYGSGKWLGSNSGMVFDYAGCGSHECDVSEANARLIAAAPELVEALYAILISSFHDVENISPHMQQAANKACAAIAKATGKT
jgi:hypothetical protein